MGLACAREIGPERFDRVVGLVTRHRRRLLWLATAVVVGPPALVIALGTEHVIGAIILWIALQAVGFVVVGRLASRWLGRLVP